MQRLGEKSRLMPVRERSDQPLGLANVSRVIEMAWEDRTPFEAIELQFGLSESAVISLMRRELQRSSFRMWRIRVRARATKHAALSPAATRHRASHTRQA